MQTMLTLFWISLFLLFFCYIGYGILLFLFNKIKFFFTARLEKPVPDELPAVTLVVALYNESGVLKEKIKNTLAIDYPSHKMKIIFVDDDSTDGSVEIIKQTPVIDLLHQMERRGKFAAIKTAMLHVQTPVVVFSDANAMLNPECIKNIVAHYEDPKTGGVAGEKKIIGNHHSSGVGEAESIYWQYESFMKKQDAGFNTVVGAAGELFSIRKELFKEFEEDLLLDDFIISMNICLQGYRIAYEPGAFSTETPSASLVDEQQRKIRISAGAYQSIGYLKELLNVFKHPLLSFQYLFRRLFRWTLCPLLLLSLLLTNFLVVSNDNSNEFYKWIFIAQLFFYCLAFAGWFFVRSGRRMGPLNIPFYFIFMNYCLVRGFIVFLRGKETVLWKKSLREVIDS